MLAGWPRHALGSPRIWTPLPASRHKHLKAILSLTTFYQLIAYLQSFDITKRGAFSELNLCNHHVGKLMLFLWGVQQRACTLEARLQDPHWPSWIQYNQISSS